MKNALPLALLIVGLFSAPAPAGEPGAADGAALVRQACQIMREAGLDPAAMVLYEAAVSGLARDALRATGQDLAALCAALAKYPPAGPPPEGPGEQAALAALAYRALREAGLDPAAEIRLEATIHSRALAPLRRGGIRDLAALAAAFVQYPPGAPLPTPPPTPAAAVSPAPEPVGPPARATGAPPSPGAEATPPPGAADGFGRRATGGARETRVGSLDELRRAAAQNDVNISLNAGDYEIASGLRITGNNLTLDGGGATFWAGGGNRSTPALLATGDNMILRNFRVRNGGDNLAFGSAATKEHPGSNVLVDHVSSTGSGDDGISPAYNAHDVTIRWCLIAGCTRSIFIKYGGTRVSLHHNIITRQWIRGPMASGADVDFRNNYVWNWAEWASRVDSGGHGNFVNNVWRLDAWAPGKPHGALIYCTDGTTNRGNIFENCSAQGNFSEQDALQAPPIQGEVPAADLRPLLLDEASGAGCVPRDQTDREYLTIQECAPRGDPAVGLVVPSARRGR